MWSPVMGSLSRLSKSRRLAVWTALALGGVLPLTGCQVEYAGMTLPSGKYMHDDVQYFAPGPDFPWMNTQAATQRARMQAMGIDPNAAANATPLGAAGPGTGAPPNASGMGGALPGPPVQGVAEPGPNAMTPPPPVPGDAGDNEGVPMPPGAGNP